MLGVYTETYPCRPESMVFRPAKGGVRARYRHVHHHTHEGIMRTRIQRIPTDEDCDGVHGKPAKDSSHMQ